MAVDLGAVEPGTIVVLNGTASAGKTRHIETRPPEAFRALGPA